MFFFKKKNLFCYSVVLIFIIELFALSYIRYTSNLVKKAINNNDNMITEQDIIYNNNINQRILLENNQRIQSIIDNNHIELYKTDSSRTFNFNKNIFLKK
jgi:hypothetical protein